MQAQQVSLVVGCLTKVAILGLSVAPIRRLPSPPWPLVVAPALDSNLFSGLADSSAQRRALPKAETFGNFGYLIDPDRPGDFNQAMMDLDCLCPLTPSNLPIPCVL